MPFLWVKPALPSGAFRYARSSSGYSAESSGSRLLISRYRAGRSLRLIMWWPSLFPLEAAAHPGREDLLAFFGSKNDFSLENVDELVFTNVKVSHRRFFAGHQRGQVDADLREAESIADGALLAGQHARTVGLGVARGAPWRNGERFEGGSTEGHAPVLSRGRRFGENVT